MISSSKTRRSNIIGVSTQNLDYFLEGLRYDWIKAYGPQSAATQAARSEQDEVRRLKAELKRVMPERDILKEAARYLAQESKSSTGLFNRINTDIQ